MKRNILRCCFALMSAVSLFAQADFFEMIRGNLSFKFPDFAQHSTKKKPTGMSDDDYSAYLKYAGFYIDNEMLDGNILARNLWMLKVGDETWGSAFIFGIQPNGIYASDYWNDGRSILVLSEGGGANPVSSYEDGYHITMKGMTKISGPGDYNQVIEKVLREQKAAMLKNQRVLSTAQLEQVHTALQALTDALASDNIELLERLVSRKFGLTIESESYDGNDVNGTFAYNDSAKLTRLANFVSQSINATWHFEFSLLCNVFFSEVRSDLEKQYGTNITYVELFYPRRNQRGYLSFVLVPESGGLRFAKIRDTLFFH